MTPATRQRLQVAWQALQQGRPAAAVEHARAAAQSEPDAFDAWRMLGVAEHAAGRPAAGNAAFLRALQLRPGDAPAALDLGTALLNGGDATGALPWLERAVAGLPADARAAFRLGTALHALGRYEQAAAAFAAATHLQPDWAQAWHNLASAHGARQAYPEAIAAARQATVLRPADAEAHVALALLYSNLFDPSSLEAGLDAARAALALAPGHAAAHRTAAMLHRKKGEGAAAEFHARRAVELDPQDADAVQLLGEQQVFNGDPRAAVDTFRAAAERGLAPTVLRRQHAIALLSAGESGAALAMLEPLLAQCPQDQRVIAHMGVAIACHHGADRSADFLGLARHVTRVPLEVPPGFATAEAYYRALADDIRNHSRQRWEPAGLAARQAYLSGDLLADRTPAIAGFEACLRQAIDAYIAGLPKRPDDAFLRNVPGRYRLHVWATRAAGQGYIDTHIHEDSWLSGAFYVELPPSVDAGEQGWIEFGRPYGSLPPHAPALRTERPVVGDLLLFPSYLFHRTLPYRGDGERISISFDLAAA